MNLFHRWYCRSAGWKRRLHGRLLPWAVANEDLGERVLEIGPGPGIVTDWLSTQAPSVTSVEIDHKLASALTARVDKSIVTVVEADATSMPLPDEHFDSALCLTMLHHVPTVHLQDRLLSEAHRVLKPGALLMGSDSTPSPRWRFYHLFDTCMPVDPTTFALRLTAAGFTDVEVETGANSLRFRARKPYRA